MVLQDLLNQLALGELNQHKYAIGGTISEADIPAVITHINGGLTNLYSYFPLAEREVTIQQYSHITSYRINSQYALSNTESTEPYKWVRDSEYSPFLDDIIRIGSVFDEIGNPVPLNDSHISESVFTSAWDTLQIPYPNAHNALVVLYRAKHKQLYATDDLMTTEVVIPPVLEEALRAYVAGRCFVSLGNQASAGLASYYSQRYQEQVTHVETMNLLRSSDADINLKLTHKGFI